MVPLDNPRSFDPSIPLIRSLVVSQMPLGSNRLNVRCTARQHAKLVLEGRTKFKRDSRFGSMTPAQATECIVKFPVQRSNPKHSVTKTALALDAWIEANFPPVATQSRSCAGARDTKAEDASAASLSPSLADAYAQLDADEKMLARALCYAEQLRCKKAALQKQTDEKLGADVARKLAKEKSEIEALNARIRALVDRSVVAPTGSTT